MVRPVAYWRAHALGEMPAITHRVQVYYIEVLCFPRNLDSSGVWGIPEFETLAQCLKTKTKPNTVWIKKHVWGPSDYGLWHRRWSSSHSAGHLNFVILSAPPLTSFPTSLQTLHSYSTLHFLLLLVTPSPFLTHTFAHVVIWNVLPLLINCVNNSFLKIYNRTISVSNSFITSLPPPTRQNIYSVSFHPALLPSFSPPSFPPSCSLSLSLFLLSTRDTVFLENLSESLCYMPTFIAHHKGCVCVFPALSCVRPRSVLILLFE